jgi:CRP-like cAMP-binding protein
MASYLTSQIVEPAKLSERERDALTEELYQVQNEVFDGVDKKTFAKYVIHSPAQASWISVYRDGGGRAVGYMAFHRFDRTFGERQCAIFRAEAGILRDFRGQSSMGWLFLKKALPYVLSHPGQPVFYLGSLVHPSSYHGFSRYAKRIWPNPREKTPPEILSFMCTLADEFGLEKVSEDNSLVRKVGWCTRDTDVEREYWRQCRKPTARFFVETNPGYGEGHGLITLIPLSMGDVMSLLRGFVAGRTQRTLVSIRAMLQKIPGLQPWLSATTIEQILKGVPILNGAEDTVLRHLAQAANIRIAAPGEWLFKEGDMGEYAYIVVSGAVYVITERDGEQIILDELHEGDVLGEMALISGDHRSASIRTATAVKLLAIGREDFLRVVEAIPELSDAVWAMYDRRKFDTAARAFPQFDALDHEARERWFEKGSLCHVKGGEDLNFKGPGVLFVSSGAIDVPLGDTMVLAKGPIFVVYKGATTIRALDDSRIIQLPSLDADSLT